MEWQTVNQKEVEDAVSSDMFINKTKCPCGIPIYTFRKINDSMEGLIVPCTGHDRADRAKCAHLVTYDDNEVQHIVAIRLSKMLFDAIDKETNTKPRLWKRYIRITYIGNQATKFGHAKKIYKVELNKGVLRDSYESVTLNEYKSSKPRKRKISRPDKGDGI